MQREKNTLFLLSFKILKSEPQQKIRFLVQQTNLLNYIAIYDDVKKNSRYKSYTFSHTIWINNKKWGFSFKISKLDPSDPHRVEMRGSTLISLNSFKNISHIFPFFNLMCIFWGIQVFPVFWEILYMCYIIKNNTAELN